MIPISFEHVVFLTAGICLLVWGADFLVRGSTRLVAGSAIGAGLVVAAGTSLPELAAGIMAAVSTDSQTAGSLIVGNVIGSNITNIGLVLAAGVLAIGLLIYFDVKKAKVTTTEDTTSSLTITTTITNDGQETRSKLFIIICCTISLGALGLLYILSTMGKSISQLQTSDGIILSVCGIASIILLIFLSTRKIKKHVQQSTTTKNTKRTTTVLLIIVGAAMLYVGASLTTKNAVNIASSLQISEYVIALSLVAIGTSLPELLAVLAAVYRHKPTVGLAAILTSCIFNILIVIGISILAAPDGLVDTSEIHIYDYAAAAGFVITGTAVWLLMVKYVCNNNTSKKIITQIIIPCLLLSGYIIWLNLASIHNI